MLAALAVVAIGVGAYFSFGTEQHGDPLESWVAGTKLGQSIGTLQGDGALFDRAVAARKKPRVVRTICLAMAADAGNANGELPSPDVTVTQLLARAYGLYYDAAQECAGGSTLTPGVLRRSARQRRVASELFSRVLRRVATLTGAAVPTTTTTIPNLTGTAFF